MTAVGLALFAVATALWLFIVVHGFKASLGQGFACLCVPFYALYFGFARLPHRRRLLILAAWIVATVLGTALIQCGTAMTISEEIRSGGAPASGR
jgi:translocator protein